MIHINLSVWFIAFRQTLGLFTQIAKMVDCLKSNTCILLSIRNPIRRQAGKNVKKDLKQMASFLFGFPSLHHFAIIFLITKP